jgi:hypothetical protein
MFKVLILQASHGLSDERAEYLIRDRLWFMRFLGLGLADTVPDANTIWTFRETLTRTKLRGKPAIEVLFKRFDTALAAAGFLAMSGQIIDATIVAAPKQRNTDGEKREIKEGRTPAAWAGKPAKPRQKDRDARWTVTDASRHDGALQEAHRVEGHRFFRQGGKSMTFALIDGAKAQLPRPLLMSGAWGQPRRQFRLERSASLPPPTRRHGTAGAMYAMIAGSIADVDLLKQKPPGGGVGKKAHSVYYRWP